MAESVSTMFFYVAPLHKKLYGTHAFYESIFIKHIPLPLPIGMFCMV